MLKFTAECTLPVFHSKDREPSPEGPQRRTGPFEIAARAASEAGLVVIPCGGATEKIPLVRWSSLKAPLPQKVLSAWLSNPRFATANLGISTGPSRLTVIDSDTLAPPEQLFDRFGATPVVVSTPRGGFHLYYRSRGEGCGKLEENGLHIDVKGAGGFIVVPPSIRAIGEHAGKGYAFVRGSFGALSTIPPIRQGALPSRFYNVNNSNLINDEARSDTKVQHRADSGPNGTDIGRRNKTLFDRLRMIAAYADNQEDLLQEANALNARLNPPLEGQEVCRITASVWQYREKGRLFVAGLATILVPGIVFDHLAATPNGADAMMLLTCLIRNHAARDRQQEDFVIVAEAMARDQVIFGWGIARFRKATKTLLDDALITMCHRGGKRRGDPHRYRLALSAPQ